MAGDHWRMVLERQDHAVLGRPARTLDESFTAPGPCRGFAGFVLRDAPDALRDVVSSPVLTERDPGPGAEHPQHRRTEIGGHADERLPLGELRPPLLRDGAGEIIVRGDGINRHAGIRRAQPQLATARRGQIEGVSMRPLAVDFDALIAVLSRAIDDLLQGQGGAAVPDAQVGNGVEADLHSRSPSLPGRGARAEARRLKPVMMTEIAGTGG